MYVAGFCVPYRLMNEIKSLCVIAAKNVILAGVKSVTLHDTGLVEAWDLSANFCLLESDIGKYKASACAEKLQELNTAVLVTVHTSEISESFLSGFQVLLLLFSRLLVGFLRERIKLSRYAIDLALVISI